MGGGIANRDGNPAYVMRQKFKFLALKRYLSYNIQRSALKNDYAESDQYLIMKINMEAGFKRYLTGEI